MTPRRAFSPTMLLTAATVALAGCDGPTANSPPSSALVAVPASVQAMMAERFPADGEIHLVHSVGAFQVEPDTQFCTFRPGYGIDGTTLSDALNDRGQSTYWNGSPRTNCSTDNLKFFGRPAELKRNAVFMRVTHSENAIGQPYKLVLAVWQGDPAKGGAAWVGGVERNPDTYLPCESCFAEIVHGEIRGTDQIEPVRSSMNQDVDALGRAFVAQLESAQKTAE